MLQLNDEQSHADDDNVDYEEDDPALEDIYDDEEEDKKSSTEEPTPAPVASSLTEYKWRHYGTRSRVEESRRNQLQLTNNNNGKLSQYNLTITFT